MTNQITIHNHPPFENGWIIAYQGDLSLKVLWEVKSDFEKFGFKVHIETDELKIEDFNYSLHLKSSPKSD